MDDVTHNTTCLQNKNWIKKGNKKTSIVLLKKVFMCQISGRNYQLKT